MGANQSLPQQPAQQQIRPITTANDFEQYYDAEFDELYLTQLTITPPMMYLLWEFINVRGVSRLCMDTCQVDDSTMHAFWEALQSNKTLHTLSFRDNFFGVEAMKNIAAALKENDALTSLSFFCIAQHRTFGEKGARYISDGLMHSKIRYLKLYNHAIGNEDAMHLAKALEKNTTLVSLELGRNNIGDEGAMYLAKLFEKHTTLDYISLYKNNIGDAGARHLAHAFAQSQSLRAITLRGNPISEVGVNSLIKALKQNPKLTDMFVDVQQDAVDKVLKYNLALQTAGVVSQQMAADMKTLIQEVAELKKICYGYGLRFLDRPQNSATTQVTQTEQTHRRRHSN